ncbi:hypothetical protein ACFE04_031643 [Oxalis oulophora]
MPFPMKIQPLDYSFSIEDVHCNRLEQPVVVKPPVVKSRLKRIFDLQFLRNTSAAVADKVVVTAANDDGGGEFEPSSVCLTKMVQNFIEGNPNEKQRCGGHGGRNRCSNCFNGVDNSSEDELDSYFCSSNASSSGEAMEILKSLVGCMSVRERILAMDIEKIVERNNIAKRKDDYCRKVVADGLIAIGYDASICKSRWENSFSYPAGEYEYVDVIVKGERLIVDIDFRPEFEIARSTKQYKSILQLLPFLFVGKSDRLAKIISIVSEASKQSLKKRGMHLPPWRKEDYVKAKWLSPHPRANPCQTTPSSNPDSKMNRLPVFGSEESLSSNEEKHSNGLGESIFYLSDSDEGPKKEVPIEWKPEAKLKLKSSSFSLRMKAVSGLASIIEDDQ